MLLHATAAASLVASFSRRRVVDVLSWAAFAGTAPLLVATLPVDRRAVDLSLTAIAVLLVALPWLRRPLEDSAALARMLVGGLLLFPHVLIWSEWSEPSFAAGATLGILGGLAVMIGEWLELRAAPPSPGSRLQVLGSTRVPGS